jgi:hypothetical protein
MLLAAAAVSVALAACSRPATEEPAATDAVAPVTAPDAIDAPSPQIMTKEALALCFSAIEAWDDLGVDQTTGTLSAEDAERLRNRLKLKRMEMELADGAAFTATLDQAGAMWKDKTPADIEAAARSCLQDIE